MKEIIELNSDAVNLRKQLGEDCNAPIDIFSLIHNNDDLTLIFYPMSKRISGMCIKENNNKIIAVNSNSTYGRQRFTVAHELYHLFYQENLDGDICISNLDSNKSIQEREADRFASYFLAPYDALSYFIKNRLKKKNNEITLEEVVKIEQNFGMSRQATLWRLVNDGYLKHKDTDNMKHDIIKTAKKFGFDDNLYTPTPENKKYGTYGKYIKLVESVREKKLVSNGKYEELLLDGFRGDIVYGYDTDEEELYD